MTQCGLYRRGEGDGWRHGHHFYQHRVRLKLLSMMAETAQARHARGSMALGMVLAAVVQKVEDAEGPQGDMTGVSDEESCKSDAGSRQQLRLRIR